MILSTNPCTGTLDPEINGACMDLDQGCLDQTYKPSMRQSNANPVTYLARLCTWKAHPI